MRLWGGGGTAMNVSLGTYRRYLFGVVVLNGAVGCGCVRLCAAIMVDLNYPLEIWICV